MNKQKCLKVTSSIRWITITQRAWTTQILATCTVYTLNEFKLLLLESLKNRQTSTFQKHYHLYYWHWKSTHLKMSQPLHHLMYLPYLCRSSYEKLNSLNGLQKQYRILAISFSSRWLEEDSQHIPMKLITHPCTYWATV